MQKNKKDFYQTTGSRQCKDCIKKRISERYRRMSKNPEWLKSERIRLRDWKRSHIKEVREVNKKWYRRIRFEVMRAYGGRHPQCKCCGESIDGFLAIDHMDGGGGKHLKELRIRGSNFYLWLKKNNFPKRFQILCHNCNFAKGRYGACPHKK